MESFRSCMVRLGIAWAGAGCSATVVRVGADGGAMSAEAAVPDGGEGCPASPTQCEAWRREVAGDVRGNSLAVDDAGDVYVTGDYVGALDLGAGASLQAAGDVDGLVASFTPAGGLRWARSFGAAGCEASGLGVAVDAAGEVYVAGRIAGGGACRVTVAGGALRPGAFVARLSNGGEFRWSRWLHELEGFDALSAVAVNADTVAMASSGEHVAPADGVVSGALQVASVSRDGAPRAVRTFATLASPARVAVDRAGQVVFTAYGIAPPEAGVDASSAGLLVGEVSPELTFRRARRFDSGFGNTPLALRVTPSGASKMAIVAATEANFGAARLAPPGVFRVDVAPSGAVTAAHTIPRPSAQRPVSVALRPDGAVVIVWSSRDGWYVSAHAPSGAEQWTATVASGDSRWFPRDVATAPTGAVYVLGGRSLRPGTYRRGTFAGLTLARLAR